MGVETTVNSTVHQPFMDTPARAPRSAHDLPTRFSLFGFVFTKKRLGSEGTRVELRRPATRDWWVEASWHKSRHSWSLVLTKPGSHLVTTFRRGHEGDKFFDLLTFTGGKAPKEQP